MAPAVLTAARGGARRLPVCTLLLAATAALAYALPPLAAALLYDRDAIAGGQWWRLLSGNLVHLSARHLYADGAALLLLGGLAEARWRGAGRTAAAPLLYVFAGAAVGVALLLAQPDLLRYGGLSGIVSALLATLLLEGLRHDAAHRRLWAIGLALLGLKLLLECASGTTLLAAGGTAGFVAVPLAHLAGALAALLLWVLQDPDANSYKIAGARLPRRVVKNGRDR